MFANDVTRTISAIVEGDMQAAEQLLPIVYEELRALAARRLGRESAGQTIQPTALVHEAYLRLVGADPGRLWEGKRHFFGAASQAMRRILVENARHKHRVKNGALHRRIDLSIDTLAAEPVGEDLLALDEALDRLNEVAPQACELVKLRYFGGLGAEEAGELLGLSPRSTYRCWAFAKAWLYSRLDGPTARSANPSSPEGSGPSTPGEARP